MRTARPKSLLERRADADLWRHTLSQIPTLAGRLIYLASLRDAVSGRYEHHGLSLIFGEEDADKAIHLSHRKATQDWLTTGLSEKHDDMLEYLSSTGEAPKAILRHWQRSDTWTSFLPIGLLPAEKALYCSDMRNLIKILSARLDGAATDPTA